MSSINDVTRSWFSVFNNPAEHGYPGEPEIVCNALMEDWVKDSTTRSGIWAYCVSENGLHHVHMVLEDKVSMRFAAIKKSYAPGAHLEPTKGTKAQAEDYIYKRYPFEEKGEKIIHIVRSGEIVGAPSTVGVMDRIAEALQNGARPSDIFDANFKNRRYAKEITAAYFALRIKETPIVREVKVHWIFGETGTGKTRTILDLHKQFGAEEVFLVADHNINGAFDTYEGQKVLFLDDIKGDFPYRTLLQVTDCYRSMVHARFTDVPTLWKHVYITSTCSIEMIHLTMVKNPRQQLCSLDQLLRRMDDITYCYRSPTTGQNERLTVSASEYTTAEAMVNDTTNT